MSVTVFRAVKKLFRMYPLVPCPFPEHHPIVGNTEYNETTTRFGSEILRRGTCIDTPLLKNLTIRFLAQQFRAMPESSVDVQFILNKWVFNLGDHSSSYASVMTEENMYSKLANEYWLVGIKERLNEFIVLLALHFGWDLTTMYYLPCKEMSMNITLDEFGMYFPELVAKLERMVQVESRVYLRIKNEFDKQVARLNEQFNFTRLVNEYERGLKRYQQQNKKSSYRWEYYRYLDGHREEC
jgi:hypothetical protein